MNKYLLTAYLLVLLIAISSCGLIQRPTPISNPISTNIQTGTSSESSSKTAEQIPIIFDDDGSPDGTTALLYILSHPKANLKAATISYGETHPEIYIQHIGRIMDALGMTDIPLGYGQDSPLAGNNGFPEGVRLAGNNFWGLPIPNADKTYPVQTASELMVSVINKSPTPVTIFVSGPATNLAQALQLDPNIKNNIAAVYMMGGAVYVAGNIDDLLADHDNKVAEWNIFGDPQAAKIAFESGIDFNLIPLDATNQVLITKQDISQWRQGEEVAGLAADIYDMVLNNQGGENGKIWDLMTAAIMLNPDLCRFQPLHLQVITQEGNTSGQTAVVLGEAANIYVCLEPDADMIRQTLINVFSRSTNNSISSSNLGPASITATASASLPDSPPTNAVDGNSESIWNAGAGPEQWIQLDLGKPTAVSTIRLVVSQYPAGNTIHQIWGGAEANNLTLLNEFKGFTQDSETLEFKPSIPLSNIRYIKIITTLSTSWIAWREIEVTTPG